MLLHRGCFAFLIFVLLLSFSTFAQDPILKPFELPTPSKDLPERPLATSTSEEPIDHFISESDSPIQLGLYSAMRGFSQGGNYATGSRSFGVDLKVKIKNYIFIAVDVEGLKDFTSESPDPARYSEWWRFNIDGRIMPQEIKIKGLTKSELGGFVHGEYEENTPAGIEYGYMAAGGAEFQAQWKKLLGYLRAGFYGKHTELDDDPVQRGLGLSHRPDDYFLMRMDYGPYFGNMFQWNPTEGLQLVLKNQAMLKNDGSLREISGIAKVRIGPELYLPDSLVAELKDAPLIPVLVLFGSIRHFDLGRHQDYIDWDTEVEYGILLVFPVFN